MSATRHRAPMNAGEDTRQDATTTTAPLSVARRVLRTGVAIVGSTGRRVRAAASLLTPQKLSGGLIDRLHDRRTARASADPIWSAIQQRRHDSSGTVVFLSDDLTLADWQTQQEIEHRLIPDPWWLPTAQRLHHARPLRLARRARHLAQRVTRGWDDTSTYDLGGSTTARLADQLDHLADTTHGWPDALYPTFDAWAAELRHQASQLRRYAGSPAHTVALDRWHELATTPGADPKAEQEAREQLDTVENADRDAARAAMHWVADHLDHLWD